jgi:uncharacterized membrane protein YfhO
LALAGLFALAALYFLPVLAQGNSQVLSRVGQDTWLQFFSWKHFGYEAIARGELPLWNPYIFSGTPYIAGIQSAIFYPLHIIYLLFPTAFAINLSIALHCWLASVFTYFYARYLGIGHTGSTVAAITFVYSAPYFLHIYAGHLSHLATMVWLPLLFLVVEAWLRTRKSIHALLGGIVLSVQVLAGHPQYLFYSTVTVCLYVVMHLAIDYRQQSAKRLLALLAGFAVLFATGALLSAVQLLPTIELTRHSVREGLTYEWVSIFSLPPEMLVTLLIPDFFGDMMQVSYWGKNYLWEMSVYIGIIPLAMVVVALLHARSRQVWIFGVVAIASCLLALGKHTPLLRLLYTYVPGFNMFRGLSKFVFIFAFASAIIAGSGVERLLVLAEERSTKLRSLALIWLASSIGLLTIGLVGWLYGFELWKTLLEAFKTVEERYEPLPTLTEHFFQASRSGAWQSMCKTALCLFLLGALLWMQQRLKGLPQAFLPGCLLAFTVIDLWLFGSHYLVTFRPEDLRMDQELKAFLQSDKEPFRVATPLFDLLNIGMLEEIENVGGYDAIVLKHYSELINVAQQLPINRPHILMRIQHYSPLLDLLNVKYYIVASSVSLNIAGFELVFQNHKYKVYKNTRALPRSFVVHDVRVMQERNAVLLNMTSLGFRPMSYAIIDQHITGLPSDTAWQSPVPHVLQHTLHKVVIKANLTKAGLLVLGDVYYPGWQAFVDGRETTVYRANYVMRAVFVPEGEHVVEFYYRPLSLKIGAIVSSMALVFIVGWLYWAYKRH